MGKRKSFKCVKCDRRFSMAAHLARHTNSVHKRKTAPTKTAKRRPAAVTVKRAAGGVDVIGELRFCREALIAQRAGLDAQIGAFDNALAILGPSAPAVSRRGRRANGFRTGSVKTYIARVLKGRAKPMAVKDITAAVIKAGYKTKNKTLAKSVGNALSEMPIVSKVARGTFRLK